MTAIFVEYLKPGGIAGADLDPAEPWIARLRSLAPDGIHKRCMAGCTLIAGMRRIGEHNRSEVQPFVSLHNGDVVVFDGRLDDRENLIRSLRSRGFQLRVHAPDVELVAASWQAYGNEFASRLRGDFSFVLISAALPHLVAIRDPMGCRSLLYGETENAFIFSNELPALLIYPGVDRKIDRQAIGDFLVFGHLDFYDKSATAFSSIRHLQPAEKLQIVDGNVSRTRYWTFPRRTELPDKTAPRDIPRMFRNVLSLAVRDRLDASDVLISLSGGLDSPSIAAIAANEVKAGRANARLRAFTMIAEEGSLEQRCAQLTADRHAIPHDVRRLSRNGIMEPGLPTWSPTIEFGAADSEENNSAMYQDYDRVLFGSASDSVFFPETTNAWSIFRQYGLDHLIAAYSFGRRIGERLSWGTGLGSLLSARNSSGTQARGGAKEDLPVWMQPTFIEALNFTERAELPMKWQPPDPLHPTHPTSQYWLQWPSYSGDRGIVGREHRMPERTDPFLDLRVIEFVFSVPVFPWCRKKFLLREAMQGLLPDEVRLRSKVPGGNYAGPLIDATSPALVNSWESTPMLDEYIDRSKIPRVNTNDTNSLYVDLRPFFLQRWFDGLPAWAGSVY